MLREVFIVSAVRTPIGKLGGALKDVKPEELVKHVICGVIAGTGLKKEHLDEVIFGQTKQTTDCPNLARVGALMAGIPEEVPAYTVHRQCSSGMQAIVCGAMQIQTGESDVLICGGAESMSTAPYYVRNARYGFGSGNVMMLDPNTESQPRSQPADIYGELIMGWTAETVAQKYSISREAQDEFAYDSQQKAVAAIENGRFAREITPCSLPQKKQETQIFDTDEFPRKDTSLEKLSKLKPSFQSDGTVTAGNSSGRNDGAAALILASEKGVKKMGVKPMVKILSYASAGVDPRVMGIGPVPATKKALKKCSLDIDQIGLVEINEAFAAQTLACAQGLNIDKARLNVNGGAIALGHPLGMSGARILMTLAQQMKEQDETYGLATICVAGGLGMSVVCKKA